MYITPAVTAEELALLVPTIERRNVEVFLRAVLNVRTPKELNEITPIERIKTGIWELMRAGEFVTDGQARLLLDKLSTYLRHYYNALVDYAENPLPVFRITFAEQRWVNWPGCTHWYDIAYDEFVQQLPRPPVLSIVCDVTSLFLRHEEQLAKLRKGKDAGPQHHAETAGGSEPGPPRS